MKKWVIFIIIVLAVSLAAFIFNTVDFSSDIYLDLSPDGAVVAEDTALRVTNVSGYSVSPGVLVIHNRDFSMNFLGDYAPAVYESLSEVGDPSVVLASLKDLPGVYDVFEISLLEPQQHEVLNVSARDSDALISYMAMIVPTNDGVVWLNSYPLYTPDGNKHFGAVVTEVLDMGTEQNSPLGSGFQGGQPDLSRGAENIENGVSAVETVRHHPQFYDDPAVSTSVVRIDFNS